MIRTAEGQLPNVLRQMKEVWRKVNPDQDFEYSDPWTKDFKAVYVSEQRMKKLFTIFSVLAIVIAGVGLFGLSALFGGAENARAIDQEKY